MTSRSRAQQVASEIHAEGRSALDSPPTIHILRDIVDRLDRIEQRQQRIERHLRENRDTLDTHSGLLAKADRETGERTFQLVGQTESNGKMLSELLRRISVGGES